MDDNWKWYFSYEGVDWYGPYDTKQDAVAALAGATGSVAELRRVAIDTNRWIDRSIDRLEDQYGTVDAGLQVVVRAAVAGYGVVYSDLLDAERNLELVNG